MKSSEAKSVKSQPSSNVTPLRGLGTEDLQLLKAPFPKDRLGIKVQSLNKERTRALLVLYLQHTDVQDRLEEVDPAWSFEVLSEERLGDTVYARARMTLKDVSRENVGEGADPKAAYSDALKRCAMLFGVGRYLYDAPLVWVDYNEARDRYKSWSISDYEQAARSSGVSPQPKATPPKPGLKTEVQATQAPAEAPTPKVGKKTTRSREQLNRVLMGLYRPYLTKFPDTRFVELLQSRYNVGETRLMTIEQLEDLAAFMEGRLKEVA